jgi:hypothetical protein
LNYLVYYDSAEFLGVAGRKFTFAGDRAHNPRNIAESSAMKSNLQFALSRTKASYEAATAGYSHPFSPINQKRDCFVDLRVRMKIVPALRERNRRPDKSGLGPILCGQFARVISREGDAFTPNRQEIAPERELSTS